MHSVENETIYRASGRNLFLEVTHMYSKRYKQIIWNDTAANPYSKENLARRLLTYTDDAEKIQALTGFNEKKQDTLREKNSQAVKVFNDFLLHTMECQNQGIDFRSSRNGADLDTAVMEVLDLTEEQYVLHKQSILRRLERKRNKRSV